MKRHSLLVSRTLRFKLLSGFLLLIIPLVAFMIYNNMYAIDVVRNQVAQSNKNMITLYMDQIDRNLEEVEKYLYNIAAQNTGLLVLEQPRTRDEGKYSLEKIRLFQSMLKDLGNYRSVDFFFMYSPANQDLMAVTGNEISYSEQVAAEESLRKLLLSEESIPDKSWFVHAISDNYYLANVVQYGGIYIGALGNIEQHLVPLSLLDLGDEGRAFLVTDHFEPLVDDAEAVSAMNIQLDYTGDNYKLTGSKNEYILVGEGSHRGTFGLAAIIPNSAVLENLPFLRRIVMGITIGALIILPIIVYLLRKLILVPINRIIRAMRRIEDGNLDVRISEEAPALEFEVMNSSFNRMIDQIQGLTINVLEEQLHRQKAELKHLQLQINPHFFLNSLNIIYNLAQVKDYQLIQEMTHSLVQYFRFMFRSDSPFVSLGDELEHTYNYLRIQELRFPDSLTYKLDIPDSLLNVLVPPLMVQTFAENAIKHGMDSEYPLHIAIQVTFGSNPDGMLHICISDNGRGFRPEVLTLLQHNMERHNSNGEQIGIWNARQRLALLYGGQARITFSVADTGGARIDIWLPIINEQEGIEHR
ncbi:sensor histidine kinase [Paenibacillus sinopodophylli]|uniref:sensor histidine kinase n=1 Tax=Paenibacillus sinopodophylli TaxID=1837342 RepID=UPI001485F85E|nr:histidine kinase [Paenibacillus sinopodophylli]